MNDNEVAEDARRVHFEGREYKVVHAHLYAGNYFDIWMMDAETAKFTVCTERAPDVPINERQVLVREEFLDVLAEAGVVQATGETFELEGRGRLHKCDVPNMERTAPERETSGSPVTFAGLAEPWADCEIQPLSKENKPHVQFEGRDCQVVVACFDIGHFPDVWLMSAESGKITNLCTEWPDGVQMDERQVFVYDKYFELLVQAGVVQPWGETLEGKHGTLHKCDLPGYAEAIPWLDEREDFEPDKTERTTSSKAVEHDEPEIGDDFEI